MDAIDGMGGGVGIVSRVDSRLVCSTPKRLQPHQSHHRPCPRSASTLRWPPPKATFPLLTYS